MLTWVEVRFILRSVLQWWWVIVIAVVLASGSAFFISRKYEEQFYVSHATLMVGTSFKDTKPDPEEVRASAALAQFYAELAHREPVLSPVRDALQLSVPWDYLNAEMMAVKVIEQANLIDITITDSNPERAAAIANAVGEQLQAFSPTSPEKIKAEQDALGEQLNDTYSRIQSLKAQQSDLDQQRAKATSASDYTELDTKLAQAEVALNRANESYQGLITLQRSSIINTISFVERATPPSTALPSKRKTIVGAAGMAGFVLALLAIFVLEKLDTRWYNRRDVEDRFRLRDLGSVPELNEHANGSLRRELSLREAHTQILLAAEAGMQTLLITSPQPDEQRTSFTLDLAHIFARSGHQVLVVGVDQYSTQVSKLLPPQETLSQRIVRSSGPTNLQSQLRPTVLPNVMLLPTRPDNDADAPPLVPTLRLPELVGQLRDVADVIIFDGPAALSGAESALLAPYVDGVVLALSPERDSRQDVVESKQRLLHQPTVRLLGAVTLVPSNAQQGTWKFWQRRANNSKYKFRVVID